MAIYGVIVMVIAFGVQFLGGHVMQVNECNVYCIESEPDAAPNTHYHKVLSNTRVANTIICIV